MSGRASTIVATFGGWVRIPATSGKEDEDPCTRGEGMVVGVLKVDIIASDDWKIKPEGRTAIRMTQSRMRTNRAARTIMFRLWGLGARIEMWKSF